MAAAEVFAQGTCAPLPVPTGSVIELSPAQAASLPAVVRAAQPGATIQLTDGTYFLSQGLVFTQPGLTIRSKSGNRNAVTLDGQHVVGELVRVMESNITVADLTLTRAFDHLLHISPETHSISGTVIHNVRGVDSAQQFVKINQNNGFFADSGVVRCSSFEMTDAGRAQVRDNCYTGGIDGLQAQGWQVLLNDFSGFWCSAGLSQHAIHFWSGSRDTTIDRNVIINSARGVGLGLGESWPVFRSYADQPCGGKTGLGHYGGAITNTVIFANDPRLFASGSGFDSGIALEQSCATNVLHNTVFSTLAPFSSIEWRWPSTFATIANNIVSHNLLQRDGGVATLAGNLTNAPDSLFADAAAGGDLHLRSTAAAAVDKGAVLTTPVGWDMDGAPRDSRPDIGADELAGGTSEGSCTLSASDIQGSQVCDSSNALWTLGAYGETLRNSVHTGGGYGSVYWWRTVNGVLSLSTLGQDNAWWSWSGTAWQSSDATEPSALGCAVSPVGMRAGEVCDSAGALWTLGAYGETLRNGVHTGGGYGSVYWWRTLNSTLVLSTRGRDDAWWTWNGASWVRTE